MFIFGQCLNNFSSSLLPRPSCAAVRRTRPPTETGALQLQCADNSRQWPGKEEWSTRIFLAYKTPKEAQHAE